MKPDDPLDRLNAYRNSMSVDHDRRRRKRLAEYDIPLDRDRRQQPRKGKGRPMMLGSVARTLGVI